MRFNLISNLNNGAGLQQDYELLRAELEDRGHQVQGVQFNAKPLVVHPADVNVFLETVVPQAMPAARQQWVIPNPEWWLPNYQAFAPNITRFLCKTYDSLRLFTQIAGDKASYLGFASRDMYCPEVVRQRTFLHVAGNSSVKSTEEVLLAWAALPYDLTLITSVPRLQALATKVLRVTVRCQVPEAEFIGMTNSHLFHLCPSQYEGYGHCLHEAMGVGAVLLTRDGPPMDEFGIPANLLIPSHVSSRLRLAEMRSVSPEAIVQKVHYVMGLSQETLQIISRQMRETFVDHQESFQQRLSEILVC